MDYITPFQDIITELQSYQDTLDYEPSIDDPESIFNHGNLISSIMSRTGKLQSDAKYHLKEAKRSEIVKQLEKLTKEFGLSVSIQKEFIECNVSELLSVYEWCQRSNRTATHRLEWCRSKLSYLKEERNASRGMNNQNNRNNGG